MNYLALAIPAFFLFVFLEFIAAKKLKRHGLFHYEGSITNLSVGIAERLLNLLISGGFYAIFTVIYSNYRIFEIPKFPLDWLFLLLIVDFVWYWYHRLGHEVNIFWAAHIVHHQSEEFNLTVSARITTIQAVIRNIFWCILPLLGFDPTLIIIVLTIHGSYSFFTHTQLIPSLPWLEKVFITPSLHAVHHASNEKYLDKNYGDVFVFWDKIFGTFQRECEKPKFGLTHPLNSYSFLWQHFHYYLEMGLAIRQKKDLRSKIAIVFAKPSRMSPELRKAAEHQFKRKSIRSNPNFRIKFYVGIQLVISVLMLTFLTAYYHQLNLALVYFFIILTILTLINCGALLEQRRWIFHLEIARAWMVTSLATFLGFGFAAILISSFLIIACSQVFELKKRYLNYLFTFDFLESKKNY